MATKAAAKRMGISSKRHKTITCAFCKGTGKDPFGVPSKLSNCQVCAGRGTVMVLTPAETCPYCKGTGVFFQHRLPCPLCGGKGAVYKIKGVKRCAKCKGGSVDQDNKLPCSNCYGLGMI